MIEAPMKESPNSSNTYNRRIFFVPRPSGSSLLYFQKKFVCVRSSLVHSGYLSHPPTHTHEMNTLTQSINQSINFQTGLSSNAAARRPRHQGGAHGGRAPAKIARAPAKITGLIMFNLGCQIKILVFWGIFGVKKSKKNQMANPVFHGG